MTIRNICKEDLQNAYKLHREYVDKKPFSYFKKYYLKNPKLFVGCFQRGKLIGICWGYVRKDTVTLNSIAVNYDYWRKGIGSKLLKTFEKQVKKFHKRTISVGSAEGFVEKFYMKNGYKPKLFLVRIGNRKKYIKTEKYSPKMKEKIKKKYNAREVIYIFEKNL